jgi:mono/diheme cytochrome c family protein
VKSVLASFLTVVLLIAAAFTFMWIGVYDIAATAPHLDVSARLLAKARDRSITVHSRGIHLPPLDGSKSMEIGFNHFHAMCRFCHGAPGYPQFQFALGLYPQAPNLTLEDVQGRSDAELYWIVKNGIKMTGMPAFGPTHDEDEILGLVAFLRSLPNLKPEEYGALMKENTLEGKGEGHSHPTPQQGEEMHKAVPQEGVHHHQHETQ